MRRRRSMETIAGRVNVDGTILAGEGFTVNKTGVGIYSVIFPSSFRLVTVTATSCGDSVPRVCSFVPSATGVSVLVYTVAGASVDDKFSFIAAGYQQ